MKQLKFFSYILVFTLIIQLFADSNDRRKNIHDANQIRTTFFNYGLVGRLNSGEDYGAEWPINTGHFYIGDLSIMIGAEIPHNDTLFHSVAVSDGPRGNNETDPENSSIYWGWEPLSGYFNPSNSKIAMNDQPETWPAERKADSDCNSFFFSCYV